jgi:hypothetical protein
MMVCVFESGAMKLRLARMPGFELGDAARPVISCCGFDHHGSG